MKDKKTGEVNSSGGAERRPLRTAGRRPGAASRDKDGASKESGRKTKVRAENHTFGETVLDWVKSMGMGLLLFLVIRTVAVQTYTIISGSMENTFLIGDFIVVNKVAYGATIPATHARLPGYTKPKRGDIVVFISNHDPGNISLVKRLVGAPGDTISMKAGVLYVNGAAQSERYVKHTRPDEAGLADERMQWQDNYVVKAKVGQPYIPKRDDWGPLVVPPERYFMMGDNRDESFDSRFWGFVEKKDIIGRAAFIYFSWASSPSDPPLVHHFRWNRIGHSLN